MEISLSKLKELRSLAVDVSLSVCKQVLVESNEDIEESIKLLKKQGYLPYTREEEITNILQKAILSSI